MTGDPTLHDTAICYRHPDRRAGVACQRCDRPICPSCMITASVGFQCPECVQGSSQHKAQQAMARGAVPVATYALIGINVAVFVAGIIVDARGGAKQFSSDYSTAAIAVGRLGEWWRLVTGGFLHAGIFHIGFNMWALYAIGPSLERMLGRARFVVLYMTCLIGGSLGVVAMSNPCSLTVGASGAIFGLFGAWVMLDVSRGINPLQSGIGTVVLINLGLTFAIPGISIGGHIGGLITGLAVGALLFGTRRAPVDLRASGSARTAAVGGLGVAMFVAAIAVAGVVSSGFNPCG